MDIKKETDQYGVYTVIKLERLPENPVISVVMSVYNGELYLKEAVESILKQTFVNFEFIIINDGSKDNSLKILQVYQEIDHRILLLDQNNIGLTKSLNRGINFARGDFIARMDADDVSLPNRFERQLKIMKEKKDIDLLGCLHKEIHKNGVLSEQHVKKITGYIKRNILFKLNPLFHSSVLMKKSIGPCYSDKWRYTQDYELYLRLIKNNNLYNDNEVLVYRRYAEDMISCRNSFEQRYYALIARYRHLPANVSLMPIYYTMLETLKLFIIFLKTKCKK